jgi:predicted PurR-regulated permease PerM
MLEHKKVTINVSNRTMVRAILWVVLAVMLFHVLGRITHALTLIFASFFLAMALNPVVGWIKRHLRLKSRVRATALAYVIVIGIIATFLVLVIPPLVSQTRTFIQEVPATVSNFQQQDSSLSRASKRYHIDEKLSIRWRFYVALQ